MNRLKKEFRRIGFRLESDFPYLPFEGVDSVEVDSENAIYKAYHYGYGWLRLKLERDGGMTEIPSNDPNPMF